MPVRLIRKKEREKAGNIYCCFCRPNKVNAIYRIGADEMTWKRV